MTIKTYTNFSKRKNSTKQPTGGTDVSVVLKEPTSIVNPVFKCSSVSDSVNYVYCESFGRYYFVSDIVHVTNDIIELHCSVDVLASAKSNIGSTSAFVERSTTAFNQWISDGEVIPTDEVVQCVSTEGNLVSNLNVTNPNYVVSVVGKGGRKNYVMNSGIIQAAFSSAFDPTTLDFTQIQDCLASLFKSIAEPGQYIKSIKWFPFTVNTGGSETAFFGFTPCVNTVDIATSIEDGSTPISQPARYYNDWRDFDSRFTTVNVYLPGIGPVQIDAKYLENVIAVQYVTDIDTGACTAVLTADSYIIGTYNCQAACDIPMGGLGGLGAANGIGKLLTAFSPNPLQFAANATGGFIDAVGGSISPTESSTGATGNRRLWGNYPYCQMSVTRLGSTGMSAATKGKPLKEARTLSTLSGYVRCSEASVSCPFTDGEKDAINSYLNSGFYYE